MNRRGFLKALPAIAIVPVAITDIAARPELSNLEKAIAVDKNFDSPFLYIEAMEDIRQGEKVKFLNQTKENPYRAGVYKNTLGYDKPLGLATVDIKRGQWGFIQTVGHCILPK